MFTVVVPLATEVLFKSVATVVVPLPVTVCVVPTTALPRLYPAYVPPERICALKMFVREVLLFPLTTAPIAYVELVSTSPVVAPAIALPSFATFPTWIVVLPLYVPFKCVAPLKLATVALLPDAIVGVEAVQSDAFCVTATFTTFDCTFADAIRLFTPLLPTPVFVSVVPLLLIATVAAS
jgi:hypothetical protein